MLTLSLIAHTSECSICFESGAASDAHFCRAPLEVIRTMYVHISTISGLLNMSSTFCGNSSSDRVTVTKIHEADVLQGLFSYVYRPLVLGDRWNLHPNWHRDTIEQCLLRVLRGSQRICIEQRAQRPITHEVQGFYKSTRMHLSSMWMWGYEVLYLAHQGTASRVKTLMQLESIMMMRSWVFYQLSALGPTI